MVDGDNLPDRRTVLKAAGSAMTGIAGVASLGGKVTASSVFTPPDLTTSDFVNFYVFRENGASYKSEWDNHIDNWAQAVENLLENHIGVGADIKVYNKYSNWTIDWDDPSDWPSSFESDENTVPCIIVGDAGMPLGYSYNKVDPDDVRPSGWSYTGAVQGSFHVNQTVPGFDLLSTPEDYVEPMLMHELTHLLSPGNHDWKDEHNLGNINAEYYPYAGQYVYEPTAMATGYVICEGLSNNPPQGTDCSNNDWQQTCKTWTVNPKTKLTECAVSSIYLGIFNQSQYMSSFDW